MAGQPKIITVHGTFAGEESSRGDKWWQIGSPFLNEVQGYIAEPLEVEPLHWSGDNSESDRRDAAQELCDRIEEADAPRVILGHSHGGSVGMLALSQLAKLREGAREKMLGLLTVGTPLPVFKAALNPLGSLKTWSRFFVLVAALLVSSTILGEGGLLATTREEGLILALSQQFGDVWDRLIEIPELLEELFEFDEYFFETLVLLFGDVASLLLIPSAIVLLAWASRKVLSERSKTRALRRGKLFDLFPSRIASFAHGRDEAISALRRLVSVKVDLVRPLPILVGVSTTVASFLITVDFASVMVPPPDRVGMFADPDERHLMPFPFDERNTFGDLSEGVDEVILVSARSFSAYLQEGDGRLIPQMLIHPLSPLTLAAPRFKTEHGLVAVTLGDLFGGDAARQVLASRQTFRDVPALQRLLSSPVLMLVEDADPLQKPGPAQLSQMSGNELYTDHQRDLREFFRDSLLAFPEYLERKPWLNDVENETQLAGAFLSFSTELARESKIKGVPRVAFVVTGQRFRARLEQAFQGTGSNEPGTFASRFKIPADQALISDTGFFERFRTVCYIDREHLYADLCRALSLQSGSALITRFFGDLPTMEERFLDDTLGLDLWAIGGFEFVLLPGAVALTLGALAALVFAPLLDRIINGLVKSRAFGSDVFGESIKRVGLEGAEANAIPVKLPAEVEGEMDRLSREDATDAIERLRTLLAGGEIQEGAGADPIALATKFEKAELLHNAYFVSDQFACYLAAVLVERFGFKPSGKAESDPDFGRYRSFLKAGRA